jgi:Domain of unknown function (DUF4070)
MFVTAGFILGFDSEPDSVAQPMADFIEEAAIPVAMVGLLYALPHTQLTRRLISEHRLYEGYDFHPDGIGDQCLCGLNFETARPRREILDDYRRVLSRIYDPAVFCARVERLIGKLNWAGRSQHHRPDDFRRQHGIETVQRMVNRFPEWRDLLWRTFLRCYQRNPAAVRQTVSLLSLFLHLGPYARHVITDTETTIARIDSGQFTAPPLVASARWPATWKGG